MPAETYQAVYLGEGNRVDHTPGSDVVSGQVVIQVSMAGMATQDIDASVLGSLAINGLFRMVKVTGAIPAGTLGYWDADGDPLLYEWDFESDGVIDATGALLRTRSNRRAAQKLR